MYTPAELRLFKLVVSISSLVDYDWELTRRIALATAELGKKPENVTLGELAELVRRERAAFARNVPASASASAATSHPSPRRSNAQD
jgi:hypothetical protein